MSAIRRVAFALSALACTPAPAPVPAPVPAATSRPDVSDAAAAEPTRTPDSMDAGAADADASPPNEPTRSTSGSFRCGPGTCATGTQTCCGASANGACVPSVPNDAPQGKVGYLKTQWEICDKTALEKTGHSMTHIDRCDESIDCGKGELCCEQLLFSEGTLSECTKSSANGATPCDFGERCIESATCRLPGTECVEGYCKRRVTQLRCGDKECSGTSPVCCGDPHGCRSECESFKRVLCTKHADCLPGQKCAVFGSGADCLRLIQDPESQQLVCQHDGDCTLRCASAGGKRQRCRVSEIPWLKSCQCP